MDFLLKLVVNFILWCVLIVLPAVGVSYYLSGWMDTKLLAMAVLVALIKAISDASNESRK